MSPQHCATDYEERERGGREGDFDSVTQYECFNTRCMIYNIY